MLKPGIVTSAGLRRSKQWFGTKRHVSIAVLAELAKDPVEGGELYDRAVAQVRMPNGIWKRTGRGRLSDLDALVLAILRKHVPPASKLIVLDLAASTGVTSVELFRVLDGHFAVDFTASDLYRDLFAVRSIDWSWTGIFDGLGGEVQHVVGPFVLPAQTQESAAYPINRLLKRLSRRWFLAAARSALARVPLGDLEPFQPHRIDEFEVSKLPLVSSDCLRMARHDPRFRFEVCDIMRPLPRRAHLIRAMNILTRDHFADDQRASALRNLIDASLPNGLLVLGWSPALDSNAVQATVYGVVEGGLTRVGSVNGGSEIDRLVERMVPVVESVDFVRYQRSNRPT